MAVFLDNRTNGSVGSALKDYITPGSRLSIISNAFSIYAFALLQDQLHLASSVRLLLPPNGGPPSDVGPLVPGLRGDVSERRFRNALKQPSTAKGCAQWIKEKVEVKTLLAAMPQNLFCIENGTDTIVIQGSPSFSNKLPGMAPPVSRAPKTLIKDPVAAQSMPEWFDQLWNNQELAQDIEGILLAQLESLCKSCSPEHAYYMRLYQLFKNNLAEADEGQTIHIRTGIKDTIIRNKLYRFQRDGVLGGNDKFEGYNGYIIANGVGLGKTFEASAVR